MSGIDSLEHYRLCRSLLKRQFAQEDVACDFRRAMRYPFAQNFQPSTAALAVLAYALQAPHPPVIPTFLSTGALPGPLPLPIAWQLAGLWRKLGLLKGNEDLLMGAERITQWIQRFGSKAAYLYYPERFFDVSELEELNAEGDPIAYDSCLGLVAAPHASLTLTGHNSGLGTIQMGSVQVRSFGPQLPPLGEPDYFGIMQSLAIGAVSSHSKDHIGLEGWARCYGDAQVWLQLTATASEGAVQIDVRFAGERSPLFMAFYMNANTCALEGGGIFYPGSLQGYKGKGKSILFDELVRLDCSPQSNIQIIPLASDGSFWNSRFLIAFEFNSYMSRASFSFKFI